MPYCRKCGQEISDLQYNNFNANCPACVRLTPLNRGADFERKFVIGAVIFTIILAIILIPFMLNAYG